ncbi:hypothetical protein SOVF_052940 [Spinacia oleracea]|uniref:Photosynthetic NDH subunit of subcomplex B 4, chloroplastic n=2 Tax=Spinacia oleracea TaxID=3562 RepID=A0A9R0J426_SPIOL|nr:photosynthetic NDH subunit of subcomplex B 4, chloroplastic [Spinacia oleracea]KNA20332.1 hypothetical protein SOVF_052940 [Spinacia oleracea]
MVEAMMSFTLSKPISPLHSLNSNTINNNSPKLVLKPCSISNFGNNQVEKRGRGNAGKVKVSLAEWPLMAVLVEHVEGQRDLITHKSIWHLSDAAIKNVYLFYMMFTCWGCCVFGAAKDPYYDSEQYRGDGGDGTGHWVYEKQEDIEEAGRAALWREELIEEIELKVGSLRELEDSARKEELLK